MNQEIRNRLRNVVTQCRVLLEASIAQDLEGKYGIFARRDHVTADRSAPMTHLSEEEQAARMDILDHFEHIKARGFKPKDALDQLVREIAFTHLNRLCAYKMMEAREVYVGGQKFREAVSRGAESNGVKFYLADHPDDERLYNTGHQDIAYRHFLDWLGALLSDEIGILFNPTDSANRLYPRQTALDEVLNLLNTGGIRPEDAELRQQWPCIWSSDETIGWVYQYFTPRELREKAREENAEPQNSYELAFRNQFFTPRYVVEFLADNTLGRTWYEMRKGDTKLKDHCRYMVHRTTEVFLKDGEQLPADTGSAADDPSNEEQGRLSISFPHRSKKDPRELRILDPASGSGHFLLYCFDLLQTIYEEAYSDPDLGPALHTDYETVEALRCDIPRLILAHNLHGIDIDLRASQIAALALWLRCQRAYQEIGLKKERPRITRSNFVCAEPMPGEAKLLKDFISQLEPKMLGQIVEVVFERMKLAGEAGSLLKIEDDIREAVRTAKQQWIRETARALDRKGQPLLFSQSAMDRMFGKPEQPGLFDLSGVTDSQFFEEAEIKVIEALREYAATATNGHWLQTRLFSEDAERGFAFVDLCQSRYDVVLMNPPFGDPSPATRELTKSYCPENVINLLAAFVLRARQLAPEGFVGAITDSTWLKKTDYEPLRHVLSANHSMPFALADLGWGVLDEANVAACAFAISGASGEEGMWAFRHVEDSADVRATALLSNISNVRHGNRSGASVEPTGSTFFRQWPFFSHFPHQAIAYETPNSFVAAFVIWSQLDTYATMRRGYTPGDTFRFFRCWWEVPQDELGKQWWTLNNGSPFAPIAGQGFFVALHEAPYWTMHRECSGFRLESEQWFGKGGIGWGKRTDYMYAYALPAHSMFSHEGPVAFPKKNWYWQILGWLNSGVCQDLLNLFCGQHKTAGYVGKVPCPDPESAEMSAIGDKTRAIWEMMQTVVERDETLEHFRAVLFPRNGETTHTLADLVADCERTYIDGLHEINGKALDALHKINDGDISEASNFHKPSFSSCIPFVSHMIGGQIHPAEVLQWCIGMIFGRWDIRAALSHSCAPANGPLPTDATPARAAGMLQTTGSLHSYPLQIASDGILVDDAEHSDDICHHVSAVIENLWPGSSDSVETGYCKILRMPALREYFRRPNKGGFWDDHVSRYTKSRRKAPIYWLLQSSNKNYALWLYYQRLDKDLLFKALVNYVEPKIRLETSRLDALRGKKAAGESGKEAKRLARDVEQLEDFLSELREFEDKLRRAANLHLTPDLNDGVVLNIAPLWELVPWKEAKSYWEELLDGEYKWSSIGKQLRQKGLVK